jgi:hypothetical protein
VIGRDGVRRTSCSLQHYTLSDFRFEAEHLLHIPRRVCFRTSGRRREQRLLNISSSTVRAHQIGRHGQGAVKPQFRRRYRQRHKRALNGTSGLRQFPCPFRSANIRSELNVTSRRRFIDTHSLQPVSTVFLLGVMT